MSLRPLTAEDITIELTPEDAGVMSAAESYTSVNDEDDYRRGFDLLEELGALEKRIEAHYATFKDPLNKIVGVVHTMASEDIKPITGADKGKLSLKARISQLVGKWKADQERLAREQAAAEQAAKDAAARAAQAARVDTLKRVADAEPDPTVADMLHRDADQLASVHVKAAPVAPRAATPRIEGGRVVESWKADIFDVRSLVRAWLDGKCVLDEQALAAGLQSQLDAQAPNLRENLGRAYPGVRAVVTHSAQARRTRR